MRKVKKNNNNEEVHHEDTDNNIKNQTSLKFREFSTKIYRDVDNIV